MGPLIQNIKNAIIKLSPPPPKKTSTLIISLVNLHPKQYFLQ
jgi:hypothetical protein